MFSLICAWINAWVNNRGAGDLRRHRANYDVIVMKVLPHVVYRAVLTSPLLKCAIGGQNVGVTKYLTDDRQFIPCFIPPINIDVSTLNLVWTRGAMRTSSNGNIFRVTGPLCGEFTGQGEFPTQKGQWRGAFMFSLICAWIKGWVNNREAGDWRRHRAHYDVIVMLHWTGTLFAWRQALAWRQAIIWTTAGLLLIGSDYLIT